jgi:Tol biopolymer transport system component
VVAALVAALALVGVSHDSPAAHAQGEGDGVILAIVGRQVAQLNLEAPRHRMLSRIATPANALEVTALADASGLVVAVGSPFPGGGQRGADLIRLDPNNGDLTPVLQRAEARESLNMPAWWPDRETLLFERQDLAGQPVGAPGQEVPRYPSRIERVLADGSGRAVLIADGRQPDAAPDGTRLTYARTTNQGASILVWNQGDSSVETLVPEGRFADVAYPRFSPQGDRIAFVAPQSGISAHAPSVFERLIGPSIAFAHGVPWDPWVMNADGSELHRVAEIGADEPSVSWSPDGTQLFVYSGTGSFIVELNSGVVTPLQFVVGYGPTVWLATTQ